MPFVVSVLAAVAVLTGAWSGGADRLVAVGLAVLIVGRYAARRHLGWSHPGRPGRSSAEPAPSVPARVSAS
jgi:hypothetical protein